MSDALTEKMEAVAEGRETRQAILKKYGFVPTSVLQFDYAWGRDWVIAHPRKQHEVCADRTVERLTQRYGGDMQKVARDIAERDVISGKTVRGKGAGISLFPPALVRFVVEFYSDPGDRVLDPMAGHNSRMQVTHSLGRHYTGYDVCHEFMEFNREVAERAQAAHGESLFDTSGGCSITLREQTSEKMVEDAGSQDLVFTSPPYWCVEHYDDNPAQLGLHNSYPEFMRRIGLVFAEALRVLKPGKFCVWNVNDFRWQNRMYAYHADTVTAAVGAGFELWDIGIVKWANCIGQVFASQVEERKMLAKAHEYLLVFRKPE